jgi:hypothetical protein
MPPSLPNSDSQWIPSKGLAAVLEEAKADILKLFEILPIDSSPAILAEEVKACIKSILFRYPEIFIRDYASLDVVRKNEISFQIENGRLDINPEPYPSQEEPPGRGKVEIIFEIEETTNLNEEAFCKLVETVSRTAASEVTEDLSRFLNIVIFDHEIEITDSETEKKYQIEKQGLNRLESDAVDKEVEKASFNFLKKIRNKVEEFKSSKGIPDDKKIEDLNKIESHDVEIFDALTRGIVFEEFIQKKAQTLQKKGDVFLHRPKPAEVVQPPDLSEIPLWRGSNLDGKALDFLKTHYGQYLSAFGAEQNSVFQDQIRAHDRGLIKGINNQLRKEGKGRKLQDFAKTRSARIDQELENVSAADLKKESRLASTLYSRLKRAAKRNAAHPSRSVTRK